MDTPRNESEMTALLESTTRDACSLRDGIALRTWHWSTSGILLTGKRREIEVGRRSELVCRIAITRTWQLLRRPARSTSSLESSRLVPDVAGVYVVRCDLEGWIRDVELVAIDAAMLDKIGPPTAPNDRMKTFRCRINDGRSLDSIAAALESAPRTWGDLASPAT